MKFSKIDFHAKNGEIYTLRSPETGDAKRMLVYLKAISEETDFGTSYPEEYEMPVSEEADFIRSYKKDRKSVMISAFDHEKLVGNIHVSYVSDRKKMNHRATLGIALIREVWNRGIGRRLMTEAINFCKYVGYEQIELEVMEHNVRATGLYESLGFVSYGRREHAYRLKDGTYRNEILMVKPLK